MNKPLILFILFSRAMNRNKYKQKMENKEHGRDLNSFSTLLYERRKNSIFTNEQFLTKILSPSSKFRSRHREPQLVSCSPRNKQQIQLFKKLKMISLSKSDYKGYDEAKVKLSNCRYKSIKSIDNMNNFYSKLKQKKMKSEERGIQRIKSSREFSDKIKIEENLLKVTKSLQYNKADYRNYMNNDSKISKRYKNHQTHCSQREIRRLFPEQKESKQENLEKKQSKVSEREQYQGNQEIENDEGVKRSSNIRLRPTPKFKWSHQRKEVRDRQRIALKLNESVRGWTKYPVNRNEEEQLNS